MKANLQGGDSGCGIGVNGRCAKKNPDSKECHLPKANSKSGRRYCRKKNNKAKSKAKTKTLGTLGSQSKKKPKATKSTTKFKKKATELTEHDVVALAKHSKTIPREILATLCNWIVATISNTIPGLNTLQVYTPGWVKRSMGWVLHNRRILALAAQLYKYLKFFICLFTLGPDIGLKLLTNFIDDSIRPLSIWGKHALQITKCIVDLSVSGAMLDPIGFSKAILQCFLQNSSIVFKGLLGKFGLAGSFFEKLFPSTIFPTTIGSISLPSDVIKDIKTKLYWGSQREDPTIPFAAIGRLSMLEPSLMFVQLIQMRVMKPVIVAAVRNISGITRHMCRSFGIEPPEALLKRIENGSADLTAAFLDLVIQVAEYKQLAGVMRFVHYEIIHVTLCVARIRPCCFTQEMYTMIGEHIKYKNQHAHVYSQNATTAEKKAFRQNDSNIEVPEYTRQEWLRAHRDDDGWFSSNAGLRGALVGPAPETAMEALQRVGASKLAINLYTALTSLFREAAETTADAAADAAADATEWVYTRADGLRAGADAANAAAAWGTWASDWAVSGLTWFLAEGDNSF